MNLYEGIFERQSIRHYRMEALDTKIINNILNYASHLENLSDNVRTGFRVLTWQNVKKHLMGTLHIKAPYYLVLFSDAVEESMLNAGYLLGQLDLYMVSRGLGTCFFNGARLLCDDENGLVPIMAIGFGKPERQYYRSSRKTKRLPISEICTIKEEISEEERCIAEAARLAPSSMNNQPWRFVLYNGRIHLFCKKNRLPVPGIQKLHFLDTGIALAYLIVGAEEFWFNPELVKAENISEKQFKRNEYVITVRLK